MRFRFCGDLEVPDWLLSEMALLSKLSGPETERVVNSIIDSHLGTEVDFAALHASLRSALPTVSDVKAAVAAFDFMVTNAAKYDVDDHVFLTETQQLGLPVDASQVLSSLVAARRDALRDTLRARVLRIGRVRSVSWRVDCVLASSARNTRPSPSVHLTFDAEPVGGRPAERTSVQLTATEFRAFREELLAARRCLAAVSD